MCTAGIFAGVAGVVLWLKIPKAEGQSSVYNIRNKVTVHTQHAKKQSTFSGVYSVLFQTQHCNNLGRLLILYLKLFF